MTRVVGSRSEPLGTLRRDGRHEVSAALLEALLEEISMENAEIIGNPWNLQEIITRKCFVRAIFMIISVIPTKF